MKLAKLALAVIAVGVIGVLGFPNVLKPAMVLAFSSVTGAARNTMVVPIRDPFYPDYQQRVSVFPGAFAGWWYGNLYASQLMKATFTSLDPSTDGKTKDIYVLGFSSGNNGVELPLMDGTVPGSTYTYYPGSLTSSDDFHYLFPATPSGELTSAVRMQIPEGSLDMTVFVPARWWEPIQ